MIEIRNLCKQFQNETEIEYSDIVFETGKHNGIVADFTENEIVIYKDIDSGLSVQ